MQVSETRDNGRERVRTLNEQESKTVQSDRHKAEMQAILAKYSQVGLVEHLREVDLMFKDVSEFEDFADLMRQTKVAEEEFMRLPSKVRELFDHSVHEWLDAAHDSDRLESLRPKLEKLGVLEPQAVSHQDRTADGRFASGSHSHPQEGDHAPGTPQKTSAPSPSGSGDDA